jgi:hypothetical protein
VNPVIAVTEGALNFRPRDARLPDTHGPWREVWRASLTVKPGQSRLLNFAGTALLLNAPTGITTVGDGPPGNARLLSGLRIEARPAEAAGPLLFDEAGRLYQWSPGSNPRPVWDAATPPESLEAIGAGKERILIQRPAGSGTWITEMIRPGAGVIWQRPGDLRGALPWNESVLATRADRHAVLRLRLTDGSPVWECPLEDRAASLIAVVNEKLWLRTYDGELIGLEVATGIIKARIRVPLAAVPEGVVDGRGRLHLCTGASYTILDLAADGAILSSEVRPAIDDGPSLVFGSAAIPTTDGRLLFFDRHGRIYTIRAGEPQPPTLLWRSAAPLLDCQVALQTLYILDREGQLSALRP